MKLHGLAMSCKILLIFAKYFYKNLFLSSLGKYFVLVWSLDKITSKLMKMRPVRNISISILAYAPKMWITFFVQKIYWAKQWKICIFCLYLLFLLFVFFSKLNNMTLLVQSSNFTFKHKSPAGINLFKSTVETNLLTVKHKDTRMTSLTLLLCL